MLKLYDYPQCPFGQKTRIVLAEKQLDYEMIFVDLRKNEQHAPDFLALNPFHKVPVLVDEDDGEARTVLYDSTVINEYLEDEYPYPALMPKDSEGRARARLMEDYRDTHFNPYCVHIMQEMRKAEGERDAQRLDTAKAAIARAFDRIEAELSGKEYLAGSFSLADIAFMSNFELLDRFAITVDPGKHSKTAAWINRLKARPSFAASAT